MILIEVVIYDSDDTSVSVQLILREDRGRGIEWVHVEDRAGTLVAHIEVPDCPRVHTVDLGRIATVQLPLRASARDCEGAETPARDILVPHPSPTPAEYPETVAPCSSVMHIDNPACTAANGAVQSLRNEIISLCFQLDATRDRVFRYRYAAAALLLAALAAFAIAAAIANIPIFGWVIAIALTLVACGLLAASVYFANMAYQGERQLEETLASLEEARARFTEAASEVMRACRCPGEITVDLTQPPCV